jgi:cytochrome P450 PksS
MNTRPAIAEMDIASSAFKANPFPYFAELRETNPIYPLPSYRGKRAWLLTRYDDVEMALRSDAFAKNVKNAMTPAQLKQLPWLPPFFKPLTNNLLYMDAPEHTRLRALVHKAFTPRMIEWMRSQITNLAHELLDKASARRRSFDLIAEYGLPLPAIMIGRMLGVPEEDSPKFQRWTQTLTTLETAGNIWFKLIDVFRFINYLRKIVRQRIVKPQDDLISAMVMARENDDLLNEDEILAMTFLLLSAGHETTVNLIGSGALALLENPAQWALLRDDPTLIHTAIEELLRFVSPADFSSERYARQAMTIHGETIPQGELVLGVIASANRDAACFDEPDTLNIRRENNRHLSFGRGVHYCVGAPLARLTGQIALNVLIERAPDLRLEKPAAELHWMNSLVARGLTALPVSTA